MENAVLFIIILVFFISNSGKIKSLTNKVESLNHKIDDLKNLLLKKRLTQEPLIQESLVEPKTDIKPTPISSSIKIEADKEKEKVVETKKEPVLTFTEDPKDIEANKIVKSVEKAPVSNTIKEKITLPKEKIQQTTFSDKINEKVASFKTNNPDIEKFIGENLISKIGILILVLGISFFVKFAIDNEWINEIGRVGIGFLSGGILLGFAHKLKKEYKAFSSILVSGAITVFYFIITYAFKEYGIFSQTTTFILLVLVTIFSVAISMLYNRKELGVLSLIGGFAVPILASTGSGNFTVLFSYLIILNIGFLYVSIKKKWFIINVLTFVFTHLFFIGWLMKDPNIAQNSLRLFLFASIFYFIFFLMNIYRVIKEKEYAMKPIVMMLFLISSFMYFGQGLYLLNYLAPSFKGAFTLALALINLASGWLLLKNKIIDKKTVYLFIGMTLTFLTLAGPIQLAGNYITLFWAAESTLLIWLSQKMKNNDFKIVAAITVLLTLGSLFLDFISVYYNNSTAQLSIVFNKGFVTGIFVTVTLLVSAYLFAKEKGVFFIKKLEINPNKVKTVLLILAGVVLYFTGLIELRYQASHYFDNYLSSTIIAIYNFVFILIGIYFAFKSKSEQLNTIGVLVSIFTMLFSINFIGTTPLWSFSSSLDSNSNPTFYVQFILFFITLYIIKLVYDYINKNVVKTKNLKALTYFIAAVFVILVSLEVLIISQPILVTPNLADADTNLYTIISNSKTAVIKTSFPILWGLLSFLFLFFGIKTNKKEFRVFALVLIAITIIKLFAYDIGNVSQGGKIIAFIILGIVLLVISFMYQRIKKLFNDDQNKK